MTSEQKSCFLHWGLCGCCHSPRERGALLSTSGKSLCRSWWGREDKKLHGKPNFTRFLQLVFLRGCSELKIPQQYDAEIFPPVHPSVRLKERKLPKSLAMFEVLHQIQCVCFQADKLAAAFFLSCSILPSTYHPNSCFPPKGLNSFLRQMGFLASHFLLLLHIWPLLHLRVSQLTSVWPLNASLSIWLINEFILQSNSILCVTLLFPNSHQAPHYLLN